MFKEVKFQFKSVKRVLTLLAVFLLISDSMLAQGVPQAMSYQAVVRDANGVVFAGANVELKMSIVSEDATATIVYQELHYTPTNDFGLVSLSIGTGQVLLGVFSAIDWASGNHYLRTEVSFNGGPFMDLGVNRLLSVPYAFLAQNTVKGDDDADPTNELQDISIVGHDLSLSNGSTLTLPDDVDDADADPINELQTLTQTGT
ncbi:MAG: hypothetical protein ACI9P5_004582, partial [Saprospiraceae bacterium]